MLISPGVHETEGIFMWSDQPYQGGAAVKGTLSQSPEIISFIGTWEGSKDTTGPWKFTLELEPDLPEAAMR